MILTFQSLDERSKFIRLVERERRQLRPKLRLPGTRPDLLVLKSSPEDERWLSSHVPEGAQCFSDIQFHPFDS